MYLLKGSQDPSSASLPPLVPTFAKPSTANGAPTERKQSVNKDGSASDSTKKGKKEQHEFKAKVGSKWISSLNRARPWAWAPFASSSRTDGAMFRHWVRKNIEYTDYPYAKFDVHMDPVTYSPEEYLAHLQSETWTRSETDRLMDLARILECRWPVIFDRFCFENNSDINTPNQFSDNKSIGTINSSDNITIPTSGVTTRKIEDLQHRYYGVASVLAQLRIAQEAATEARALSMAAVKSATASTTLKTNAVTVSSTAATSSVIPSTSNERISYIPIKQERTDSLLLESAAARSLATSAKQHQPLITHIGTGTSNKLFDRKREQQRRDHLDRLWRRGKEEEEEELLLRKEIKTIDAQLRKLKKNGGHILAAGTTQLVGRTNSIATATTPKAMSTQFNGLQSQLLSDPSSRGPSRSTTPLPAGTSTATTPRNPLNSNDNKSNSNSDIVESSNVLDEYFASTAPVPMPQYPYLQSGRLVPPATGGSSGINKSLLSRMNEVLGELNIPSRPIPTKRVCDVYDFVRKDTLTLLTLKKIVMQREGQLQSKRLRLSRMGGSTLTPEDKILDEERLLGIAQSQKSTSSVATGSSNSAVSKVKLTKKKYTGGAGARSKASSKKGTIETKNLGGTTTKKKTIKRKRKTDTGKSPNLDSSNAPSRSPVLGSATAKVAKARATPAKTVVGNLVPTSTIVPRSTNIVDNAILSNDIEGSALSSVVSPNVTSTEAVAPRAKTPAASITAESVVGDQSNNGSAL